MEANGSANIFWGSGSKPASVTWCRLALSKSWVESSLRHAQTQVRDQMSMRSHRQRSHRLKGVRALLQMDSTGRYEPTIRSFLGRFYGHHVYYTVLDDFRWKVAPTRVYLHRHTTRDASDMRKALTTMARTYCLTMGLYVLGGDLSPVSVKFWVVVCWFYGVEDWVWPQRSKRPSSQPPVVLSAQVGRLSRGPLPSGAERIFLWEPSGSPSQSKKVADELGSISHQCQHSCPAGRRECMNSPVSTECQMVIDFHSCIL